MKKIYQLGFVAALVALLPTGVLFAADGDGNGKDSKNTVSITSNASTEMVTLTILTSKPIILSDIQVTSRTEWSYINEVTPILGGVEVVIQVDHTAEISGEGEVIVIDIVGVDNITGVNTTDGNNGGSIPTNIVAQNKGDVANGTQNNNNSSNGFHQDPSTSNSNSIGGGTNPTVIYNGNKDDITIYPNPVKDETNVVTVGEILGKKIEIMDLTGHIVMSMVIPTNTRQTVLNLSMLNPGLYILSYTTEGGKVISKRIQKI